MKPLHRTPKALLALILCVAAVAACGDNEAGSTGRNSDTDTSDGSGSGVQSDAATDGSATTDADDNNDDGGEETDVEETDTTDEEDGVDDDTDDEDAEVDPDTEPGTDTDDGTTDVIDEPLGPPPCSGSGASVEGALIPPAAPGLTAALPSCASAVHVLVAPAGSRWQVQATGLPADAHLYAYSAHYLQHLGMGVAREPLGSSDFAGDSAEAVVEFNPQWSGEQAIVVARDDGRTEGDYTLTATCLSGCELRTTRYPVALLHGYAGVDSYFGILDYFHDVRGPLTERGYLLSAPVTNPIDQSDTRADQLAEQLTEWMEETGARKVNMVAHSQGGLDGRLLIAGKGWSDRVASLTTIATPHGGIPLILADFLSVQDFSPDYMDVFNTAYPNHPDVRYWSWSSRSCGILQPICIANSDGEVVDALLGASYTLLLRFGENDGIVPTESMVWGEHLGMLYADHFDEVGQIADLNLPIDPFDHRDFYRSEMERLAAAGF